MCEITHSPAFLAQEARLAESEAENDQWQKKLAETWVEVERLRLALRQLRASLEPDAGYYALSLRDARQIIEHALDGG